MSFGTFFTPALSLLCLHLVLFSHYSLTEIVLIFYQNYFSGTNSVTHLQGLNSYVFQGFLVSQFCVVKKDQHANQFFSQVHVNLSSWALISCFVGKVWGEWVCPPLFTQLFLLCVVFSIQHNWSFFPILISLCCIFVLFCGVGSCLCVWLFFPLFVCLGFFFTSFWCYYLYNLYS